MHLRMCLECGHVGCCDSSPGRHSRAHFNETGHPLIQSAESGGLEVVLYRWDLYIGKAELGLGNSTSIFFASASSFLILKRRIWPSEGFGIGGLRVAFPAVLQHGGER
jgi:hypothetical protein